MKSTAYIIFALSDLLVGLSLVLAYGFVWGTCAPPSPLCELPNVACAGVCTDPWAQAPSVMAFGLVLGLPVGVVFFLATAQAQRRPPGTDSKARARWVLAATVAAGILAAIPGLAFFMRFRQDFVTISILASAAVGLLLAGQIVRRLKPVTLPLTR
ncbi:MAG TPA: hypothetical protein VEO18_04965 [Thermoplasmata archaeon]|nr:hypothetical protein [Thermoplasmata archaeon]